MLKPENFNKYRNLIYGRTGIWFSDAKYDFVSRRVAKRMEACNINDDIDYYRYLFLSNGKEFNQFVNSLVTIETYFFRNYIQLRNFAEDILPLIEARKNSNDTLKVLSAGCSTGEEVFTLNIILREMLNKISISKVEITGIDISNNNIEAAKRGVYSERSVKQVPVKYFNVYFSSADNGFKVNQQLLANTSFKQKNLFDKKEMMEFHNYDVVFCRNVLIYFNLESAQKVLSNLHDSMNEGGYIFLGSSESLSRFTDMFNMRKINEGLFYQK